MKTLGLVLFLGCFSLSASVSVFGEPMELRANLLPECPTVAGSPGEQPQLLPIVAAIGVALIGQLVSTGVSYVKTVANPNVSSDQVTVNLDGWYEYKTPTQKGVSGLQVSSKTGCLVVVRGDFSKNPATPDIPTGVFRGNYSEAQLKGAQDALAAAHLNFDGAPSLYFEARRVSSSDQTAVTWKPFAFYVGSFFNNSFFAGSSRGLEIDVSFSTAGASQVFGKLEYPYASVKKPFISLAPIDPTTGSILTPDGQWIASPATDKIALNPTPKDSTPILPVNMTVQVTETPKPYKLATAFAAAINAASGSITTTATQDLIPSARQAANQTNEAATATALSSYATAYDTKTKDCAANASSVDCSIDKDKLTVATNAARSACNVAYLSSCDMLK